MTALLTVPEAAAELRVHRDTVYALIADRSLRAVNIARAGSRSKTRIPREALDAYVASLPPVGATARAS